MRYVMTPHFDLRSPYGHVFERSTLEQWVAVCGSVCPITDRVLRMSQCQPDEDLGAEIRAWQVEASK